VSALPETLERATAIIDVAATLAWSAGVRAIPAAECQALADSGQAPAWLVAFATFRTEIERAAPEPPASMPIGLLCSNCVASEATHNGLCEICDGLRYLARRTATIASTRRTKRQPLEAITEAYG
jgi:hypothetical protein